MRMCRSTLYNIDYDAWNKEMNAMEIFQVPEIQRYFIDKWMQVLKEQDKLACKDYADSDIRTKMIKEKIEAPENFQLSVNYKTNSMYIHFRVSRIIQSIYLSGASANDATDIDIQEFTDAHRIFNWTQTSDNGRNNVQPIIIAPLTMDKYYKWIVIDGNHRITKAILEKVKSIKAFSLDANSLVEYNLFCTGFDKLLYIFQNECVALATLVHKENYSDNDALRLAYFCSGKVQQYI